MLDIKNRIIQYPNRYKQTLVVGTSDTYDLEPITGVVTEVGTKVDRNLLFGLQGFHGNTITFNSDGSIVEVNGEGGIKTTSFPSATSIIETFVSDGHSITKTTTFNIDGSISEVIS